MPTKLALVGQERYGNTHKIQKELERGGYEVTVIDCGKPKNMQTALPKGTNLVLMIVGHLPGSVGQKVKDVATKCGVKALDIAPGWSEAYMLLTKWGLYPAPDFVPPQPVKPAAEVFTSRPTNGLTQKPFAQIKDKVAKPSHLQTVPPPVVESKPEPKVVEQSKPVEPPKPAEPPKEETPVAATPVLVTKKELVNQQRDQAHANGTGYEGWRKVELPGGGESRLVNPYIASKIELATAAAKTAEKMLREGLASVPPGDGYKKYVESQKGGHVINDGIWRRLRRKVRKEQNLTDDTAWWAGKSWSANSTPGDRRKLARELIKAHPDWSAPRITDEVREHCGIGVMDSWVRKEMKKQNNARATHVFPMPVTTPTQSPDPSPAAVQAVKALEAARTQQEPKEEIVATPVQQPAKPPSQDALKSAIDLLKEQLGSSMIEKLVFMRQADGTFKVTAEQRVVQSVEF